MSIIQDALRRREQESPPDLPSRGPPTFPVPAPSGSEPPPPPPPSRGARAPAARSKDRPGVVLLMLLLAVAAGGGYWVVRQRTSAARDTEGTPVPSASAEPSAEPASRWGRAVRSVQHLVAASAKRSAETDAAVDAGDAPPAPAPEPPSEFQTIAPPSVAPAPPAPPPEPPSRPPEARVRWPRFTVKGVIAPAGGMRGTVILNDETLQEGEFSEKGIRIVAVRGQEAFLEYEGQQRSFFAGQGER